MKFQSENLSNLAKLIALVFSGLSILACSSPRANKYIDLPINQQQMSELKSEYGFSEGSVGDLSGREFTGQIQGNLGKKVSNLVADGLVKIAPKGPIRNVLDGPVRKSANAGLGLVGSAGITGDQEGNVGVELGLAKGLNLGVSVDVVEQRVCSLREGCQ